MEKKEGGGALNAYQEKAQEVLMAVLPVTGMVLLLHFTLVPLTGTLLLQFLLGAVLITVGLTLFLLGVDLGITPLGALMGVLITRRNRLWIVIVAGLVLGFFISYAEPGLLILAGQIDGITQGGISSTSIVVVVSAGIAIMMVLGFLRMIYAWPLYRILIVAYALVLLLGIFTDRAFLAIAFDTSGATTGVLAVPFILALARGISAQKKDSKASEKDSFGLLAIASAGAILSVMILHLLRPGQGLSGEMEFLPPQSVGFFRAYLDIIPGALSESSLALLPLVVIFVVSGFFFARLSKREWRRISFGFLYSFLGLFLFFVGVDAGFMEVGQRIGTAMAVPTALPALVGVAFLLGVVTILAEPAVHVLTQQIEEVTGGYVKRKAVLVALSLGMGIAMGLSMLRIAVPGIQLWHYLLPGYLLALALTFVVPKLFVGIAFDAGGVATGPMTATFILAFTNGVAHAWQGADLLVDGFGMIAMVALMPILTLELLGLLFKMKTYKKGVPQHGSKS